MISPQRWYRWVIGMPLLLWIGIGTLLRFTRLTAKPPWTDEFATFVFSLGNSYQAVPLNQVMSIDVLLQPLRPNLKAGVGDVAALLINEDNHPPLYFVLTHLWLKLFPAGEYVSLWAARSLPALLGVVSIAAIYFLTKLAFGTLVAQLAAAMMAVSPYGIFLAQEARQYTLAILWAIASLACLVVAVKHLHRGKTIPIWLILLWIVVNSLGFATHYFFVLTLCAEALALFLILGDHKNSPPHPKLWRISMAAAGTLTTVLVWVLFVLPKNYGTQATNWIHLDRSLLGLISPPFQALATWVTMVTLLPVESTSLVVVIVSVALMLLFFVWAIPIFYRGIKKAWQQPNYLLARLFVGFVGGAVCLFFIVTYGFGIDLTRGARYSFVYFPGVIVLIGASLAIAASKKAIVTIWLVSLLGALTVCFNLGYQKYYRPDRLVLMIEQNSVPVLVATTHQSLVQTGEMMGIAWELKQKPRSLPTFFLLAHQSKYSSIATATLQQAIAELPRPFDIWAVNFDAPIELNNCIAKSHSLPAVNGYAYRVYHCLAKN